jgi:hypothetical protein
MTNSKLSDAAAQKIWSAIHFPNEINHSGLQILSLVKSSHNNSYLRDLLNDLELHGKWNNSIINEIENLFIENSSLKVQIESIVKNAKGDSISPFPKGQITRIPNSYQSREDYSPGIWAILAGLIVIIKLLLNLVR